MISLRSISLALSSNYTKPSRTMAQLLTVSITWLLFLLAIQAQADEQLCQIVPETKIEIPKGCTKGDILEIIGNVVGSKNLKRGIKIYPTAEDKARSWFYQYVGSYCDFGYPILINNSTSIADFDKFKFPNEMWTLSCKYIGYKRTVIEEWKHKD